MKGLLLLVLLALVSAPAAATVTTRQLVSDCESKDRRALCLAFTLGVASAMHGQRYPMGREWRRVAFPADWSTSIGVAELLVAAKDPLFADEPAHLVLMAMWLALHGEPVAPPASCTISTFDKGRAL